MKQHARQWQFDGGTSMVQPPGEFLKYHWPMIRCHTHPVAV